MDEFWRMIWEKNIYTIVMLTKCNEQGWVISKFSIEILCHVEKRWNLRMYLYMQNEANKQSDIFFPGTEMWKVLAIWY